MRQALFSSLGARVVEARFLDLFAGSGAYGLEALSRGAAAGVFVEQNARAVSCIRQNVAAVCKSIGRGPEGVQVVQSDARTVPATGDAPDLVFIDPPYDLIEQAAPALFTRLASLLPADGLVCFEYPGELELNPPGWTLLKRIGKGARQPTVGVFRRAGA